MGRYASDSIDDQRCNGTHDRDVTEFIFAIDDYKRTNFRPFPTWSEVFGVLRSLGYAKPQPPPEHVRRGAWDEWSERIVRENYARGRVVVREALAAEGYYYGLDAISQKAYRLGVHVNQSKLRKALIAAGVVKPPPGRWRKK